VRVVGKTIKVLEDQSSVVALQLAQVLEQYCHPGYIKLFKVTVKPSEDAVEELRVCDLQLVARLDDVDKSSGAPLGEHRVCLCFFKHELLDNVEALVRVAEQSHLSPRCKQVGHGQGVDSLAY